MFQTVQEPRRHHGTNRVVQLRHCFKLNAVLDSNLPGHLRLVWESHTISLPDGLARSPNASSASRSTSRAAT